jgi:hypothetical protein
VNYRQVNYIGTCGEYENGKILILMMEAENRKKKKKDIVRLVAEEECHVHFVEFIASI